LCLLICISCYISDMPNFNSARIQQLRAALETDSAVAAVYLFGSSVRGTATGISDIDIGILLHSTIDESRYFDLRLEYLSRIMAILMTDKVDLVVLNHAPPHLAHEIVSHGKLLLDRDPRQRASFEADRIGRYLDFKPFLAVQVRAIKEHLAKGAYFD
jgi:predicted nucleotidyltransferase